MDGSILRLWRGGDVNNRRCHHGRWGTAIASLSPRSQLSHWCVSCCFCLSSLPECQTRTLCVCYNLKVLIKSTSRHLNRLRLYESQQVEEFLKWIWRRRRKHPLYLVHNLKWYIEMTIVLKFCLSFLSSPEIVLVIT